MLNLKHVQYKFMVLITIMLNFTYFDLWVVIISQPQLSLLSRSCAILSSFLIFIVILTEAQIKKFRLRKMPCKGIPCPEWNQLRYPFTFPLKVTFPFLPLSSGPFQYSCLSPHPCPEALGQEAREEDSEPERSTSTKHREVLAALANSIY